VVATRSLPVSVPAVPVVSVSAEDLAVATCDLISLDSTPVTPSLAAQDAVLTDVVFAAAAGPKQPAFGRSRPRGEGTRARRARQRVGAKLTARAVAQPNVSTFEPSKVPMKRQFAMQKHFCFGAAGQVSQFEGSFSDGVLHYVAFNGSCLAEEYRRHQDADRKY
ncbi:unnamed protein product, partial [Effrenium voratum]